MRTAWAPCAISGPRIWEETRPGSTAPATPTTPQSVHMNFVGALRFVGVHGFSEETRRVDGSRHRRNASDEQFGDLDGVECCTLAQVVVADEHRQPAPDRRTLIGAQSTDE